MSRRLDSPRRDRSPKRSTRPDRVWSAGWSTQKLDAPGKPSFSNGLFRDGWAFDWKYTHKLFYSFILGGKKIMCALFEIGKGRRRDHRGDCQPRTTQRHQQGTLAIFLWNKSLILTFNHYLSHSKPPGAMETPFRENWESTGRSWPCLLGANVYHHFKCLPVS